MHVLDVADLCVAFPGGGRWNTVVDGVGFHVAPRETLAIVGESGSGKSVTALAAMRLLPTAARVAGRVSLAGRDLLALPEAEMEGLRGREMAMIFQEPMTSLNPVMTIGAQLRETLRRHQGLAAGAADAEALRLLDRVRIPAARARLAEHPHRLSGGMLQRSMIAMALAGRPRLLIADEPTTALDVTVQAQILALLREIQDQDGMAVLFITHDMGVVAETADRVVVMRRARVVEDGHAADVFARPREAYTRALLAAVPRLGSMKGRERPEPFRAADAQEAAPAATVPRARHPDPAERVVLRVDRLVTRFDMRGGLLGRVRARVHAVEGVSFDLRAGETLALVGESGCGKSTIGRSILRIARPTSGSIVVDGVDVLALSGEALRRHRRRMQMIFQDPMSSLNPRMRAGEILAEPLLAHGLATPAEARALALDPALIVADEAVSALDVSIKAQVVDLMLELQAALGIAYLFISHDMSVVERIAHRVAVMRLGEIVEIGPRAAVFDDPRHPYTRRLLAAVPVPDPARRRARAAIEDGELPSPLRAPSYVPPARRYEQVAPGHLVLDDAAA